MEMNEASFTGTLRIFGILVLVWLILRFLRNRRNGGARARSRWVQPDQRPKGDVRIERPPGESTRNERGDKGPAGSVTDADFEELK